MVLHYVIDDSFVFHYCLQSGDVIDSFSYWIERNSFWLILALVGIFVAAAWLIWTITGVSTKTF